MNPSIGCALAVAAITLLSATSAASAAAEEPVIGEVLEILRERGLIDEARHAELVARNQAYEEGQQSLGGRIEWSGDFRARLENFWFDEDDAGGERPDRTRGRYRLRIQGKARINDWTTAVFRLASGNATEIRSTNRSFGNGNDFDPDDLFIDRAYVELRAPKHWLGESTSATTRIGKISNPFRWKHGRDQLLWDSDINPEGAAVMLDHRFEGGARAYLNAGYFIMDENSGAKDPHVTGIQIGGDLAAAEDVALGLRGSFYSFASLDRDFFLRDAALSTLTDDDYRTFEIAAYLRYEGFEDWPVLLLGHYARNLDAGVISKMTGSDEDTGWGVGLEIGDKKKVAMLGFAYYVVETNFFPARFTDSDLFDGFTNRRGFTLYGSREILPNTELNITLFQSSELESGLPTFLPVVENADRLRLQTDLVVKF